MRKDTTENKVENIGKKEMKRNKDNKETRKE